MGDLMSTDQIKRAEVDEESAPANKSKDQSMLDAARQEANEIVAKARYDAFRMVTDARAEAEAILAEVGSTQPTTNADADLADRAADLADEIATLEQIRDRLVEKVSATRSLLNNLEDRLARIAETPTPSRNAGDSAVSAETRHSITVEVTTDEPDPLPPAASADVVSVAQASSDAEYAADAPTAGDSGKGSFYSRRSAKLPSIGASRGQSALTAVSSIRSRIGS